MRRHKHRGATFIYSKGVNENSNPDDYQCAINKCSMIDQ